MPSWIGKIIKNTVLFIGVVIIHLVLLVFMLGLTLVTILKDMTRGRQEEPRKLFE